ncbi:glycosyltransferase family 4 protein [Clostridium sartagoforme]|uniref:glycosyltransferase family 4 protein n=1 Tax=Clostridium sartagoforme TaxID=84031 RepID=UPI0031E0AE60
MKILVVNSFYYPNMLGGTEHSVKLLAEGLREQGHDLAIYCIDNFQKDIKKDVINDIVVYRGKAGLFNIEKMVKKNGNLKSKIKNKIIELRNYTALREFNFVLGDFSPDVVHTNNLFGISPLFWKICKKKNIKIVHTLRDYWLLSPTCSLEIEKKKSIFIKLTLVIYRYYFRRQTKYVDIVTAPSQFTLNKFIDKGYFKYSIKEHINNSIKIDISDTKEIIEEKRRKKDSIIKFLFVGSLYEIKGVKNLLYVFNKIDNSNIRLNICGDGELKPLVENYCLNDDRILYKGKLNSEELKIEFINNDVLIIPSIWDEPFGRVVIEANQYGLPVIGSNKGGIFEIINNSKTGETFQFDDLQDLKNRIELFSSREYVKKYFNNIEKNILEYSLQKQIELFLKLYSKQ